MNDSSEISTSRQHKINMMHALAKPRVAASRYSINPTKGMGEVRKHGLIATRIMQYSENTSQ